MARDDDDRGSEGSSGDFWERPEVVARFVVRDPDHRLVAWMEEQEGAGSPPPAVLDIGCAGGRNTVWLAERGADAWALDASAAMVEATRGRLEVLLGADEARRRVMRGRMDDLSAFADDAFDLVIALGVLQDAGSRAELERTLAGIARVLRPGGRCLVANFSPDSEPQGRAPTPVEGKPDVYLGFAHDGRPMTLLRADALDAAFARQGLTTVQETVAVRVPTERGYRTTLNAFYAKRA